MTKTINVLIAISITILSVSCSNTVQLYETKPVSSIKEENQFYVFENDSVKITYLFWAEHGQLSYTIFNKLSIPLYIDLFKSSCIINQEKNDCWQNQITTYSVGKNSLLYGAFGMSSVSAGSSTTSKEEPIVFLPPNSETNRAQFYLYPVSKIEIPGKQKDKYIDYTQSNSPVVFRNFLTVSTSDKFDKESYIDNEFYVSKVSEMSKGKFLGKLSNGGGAVYEYPYKNPHDFYIYLKKTYGQQ